MDGGAGVKARRRAGGVRAGVREDVAGYEIVWRETTAPDWTHVIAVGNATSTQLPHFSKDNVFFGVRAVDTRGHHSPVTFPVPGP